MNLEKEEHQREKFRKILLDLSSNQKLLKDQHVRYEMFIELEDLYYISKDEYFRHFYSDIFSVLALIQANPCSGSIEILGQNLYVLRQGYVAKNKDVDGNIKDISQSLKKLHDHVNLEIARISYSEGKDEELTGVKTISEIKEKIEKTNLSLDVTLNRQEDIETELKENEDIIRQQQKEYIAILGIFAAIILTFTGGMAYSTSVLENISSVSIYRVVVIACIIGIVLVSSIYLLFRFIHNIVAENEQKKKGFFSQHPLLNLLTINSIFLVILAVTVVIWLFGGVEKRNLRIVEAYQIEDETTTSTK